MARTTDDMPTISAALEELSQNEVEKIDRIFNGPDFFDSIRGLLLICAGFEGSNEDYFNEVYREICEISEQDPTEYAETIDLDNYDLDDVLAKLAKVHPVMKATVATMIGYMCQDSVDNEEGTLQEIIDQLNAMID